MVPGMTRLTVAQALVRFLAVQETERDGRRERLINGCYGIFGHGNVAGLGQALHQYRELLPFHPARNEQGMVHIAAGYARQRNRLSTFACTSSVGPGATNMVTGAALATINRLPPAPEALTRAAELTRAAKRPLIVAGGGVIYSEATAALRGLVDVTGI